MNQFAKPCVSLAQTVLRLAVNKDRIAKPDCLFGSKYF